MLHQVSCWFAVEVVVVALPQGLEPYCIVAVAFAQKLFACTRTVQASFLQRLLETVLARFENNE